LNRKRTKFVVVDCQEATPDKDGLVEKRSNINNAWWSLSLSVGDRASVMIDVYA